MHHTTRGSRLSAAFALALAATIAGAGSALADTPQPTTTGPSPTVTTTTTTSSTPDPTTTTSSTTTSSTPADPATTSTETTSTGTTTGTSTGTTTTSTGRTPASRTTADTAARAKALAALATPESDAAAAFIARTLAERDDHYVYPGGDFYDGGNTVDALIALDTVGGQDAQADTTYAYVVDHFDDYVGGFGETYAGPLGKAILGVLVHGGDPTDVGGQDALARLRALEAPNGRFSDDSQYGDYSNTIGQALDLIALTRAGAPLTSASVSYLIAQQCSDGGFRGSLGGSTCTSDPDATAFAVQALVAADSTLVCGTGSATTTAAVDTALARGLDRLEALQAASGAVESSDGKANANTTGVAAQALYAGGRDDAADDAAAFIVTLQYDGTAPEELRGGIAYSADDRSTTTPTDTDLRATPQATLGLAGGSLVDALAAGAQEPPRATVCPVVATPTTTTTTTTATSPSSTTGTGTGTGTGGGSGTGDGPAAAAPGSLALTGTQAPTLASLGVALLLVGAAALALSRRRGAHH